MCTLPYVPPALDGGTQYPVYRCRACGVTGPAAVVAYPDDGGAAARALSHLCA